MIKYVLASASPRRKELLEQVGMEFCIMPANGEEIVTKELPWEIVEELSYEKALEIVDKIDADDNFDKKNDTIVIIGSDTIVAYGKEIMGKPKDDADAYRMLNMLQNNTHQVYTGVTLIVRKENEKQVITFHDKTDVMMYPMSEKQIKEYIGTKEPVDKAGAYAIQGKCAINIKGIHGDYNNVVGLPVAKVIQTLRELNLY